MTDDSTYQVPEVVARIIVKAMENNGKVLPEGVIIIF